MKNNIERQRQYQDKYQRKFSRQWFRYCIEPLENIKNWNEMINDTSDTHWHLHHIDEIQGSVTFSREELKRLGEYYKLPADKLIFLTESEHHSIHNSGDKNPFCGKHHSEESKNKISEAHKGKYHSEESRRKMSEAHKGRNFQDSMTPEAIEEWRRHLSESLKGKMVGDKNPMHGKHHSEEAKNKISKANKGKHHSEEAKNKMSNALKGKLAGDKNPNFGKTGELNPNAKRIEIDGIPYGSIEDAVAVKGNSRSTIRNWLKNGRAKYL